LIGAKASGKSTILRKFLGCEQPAQACVKAFQYKDLKKREICKYLQIVDCQEFNPVKTDIVLLLVDTSEEA